MPLPIGIDLGTSNSLVACLDGERPRIVPNRAGERMTPSVVALDDDGRLIVGGAARARAALHPERTASEFKRLMGSGERVRIGDRSFTPAEVSALLLRA